MKKIAVIISTGLGLGFSPIAPGTVGTLLGIVLALIWPGNIFLLVSIIVLGIWSAHLSEKFFGEKDSQKVVIDEVAGFLVAVYGLPLLYLLPGFIIFRFLDISKPFFIKDLQKMRGGLGVMTDDLAAGLITNVLLRFIFYYSQ